MAKNKINELDDVKVDTSSNEDENTKLYAAILNAKQKLKALEEKSVERENRWMQMANKRSGKT